MANIVTGRFYASASHWFIFGDCKHLSKPRELTLTRPNFCRCLYSDALYAARLILDTFGDLLNRFYSPGVLTPCVSLCLLLVLPSYASSLRFLLSLSPCDSLCLLRFMQQKLQPSLLWAVCQWASMCLPLSQTIRLHNPHCTLDSMEICIQILIRSAFGGKPFRIFIARNSVIWHRSSACLLVLHTEVRCSLETYLD